MNTTLSFDSINIDENALNDLQESAQRLLTASEADYAKLQQEPWFRRVFDRLSLTSKTGQKTTVQIRDLSHAQICVIEILTALSERTCQAFDILRSHHDNIARLAVGSAELAKLAVDHKKRVQELEDHWLYNINSVKDFTSLPDGEKKVLMAIIKDLSDTFRSKDISQAQKDYHNWLSQSSGLGLSHTSDSSQKAYKSIKNIEHREIIVTHCLIYIALAKENLSEGNPHHFIKQLGGFNEHELAEIRNWIEDIKEKRGHQAFYSSVSAPTEAAVRFNIDFPDEEEIKPESTPSVDFFDPAINRTDITIDRDFTIPEGDVFLYENNNILIKSRVICDGTLSFKNCIIMYGSSTDGSVYLGKEAALEMTACKVEMAFSPYRSAETSWLFSPNESDDGSEIKLTGSTFVNCGSLIKTKSKKFFFSNSKIISPGEIFDCNTVAIDGTHIILGGDPSTRNDSWRRASFKSLETSLLNCHIQSEENGTLLGLGNKVALHQCQVKGIATPKADILDISDIFDRFGSYQAFNCEFISCIDPFWIEKTIGCNFYDCHQLFTYYSSYEITDCHFIECSSIFKDTYKIRIDLSTFWNNLSRGSGNEDETPLIQAASFGSGSRIEIKRSVFNGFSSGQCKFIYANLTTSKNSALATVSIEDCTFRGITQDDFDINASEEGIFSNKNYNPLSLTRPKWSGIALDQPYKTRVVSIDGRKIGPADEYCSLPTQ